MRRYRTQHRDRGDLLRDNRGPSPLCEPGSIAHAHLNMHRRPMILPVLAAFYVVLPAASGQRPSSVGPNWRFQEFSKRLNVQEAERPHGRRSKHHVRLLQSSDLNPMTAIETKPAHSGSDQSPRVTSLAKQRRIASWRHHNPGFYKNAAIKPAWPSAPDALRKDPVPRPGREFFHRRCRA